MEKKGVVCNFSKFPGGELLCSLPDSDDISATSDYHVSYEYSASSLSAEVRTGFCLLPLAPDVTEHAPNYI